MSSRRFIERGKYPSTDFLRNHPILFGRSRIYCRLIVAADLRNIICPGLFYQNWRDFSRSTFSGLWPAIDGLAYLGDWNRLRQYFRCWVISQKPDNSKQSSQNDAASNHEKRWSQIRYFGLRNDPVPISIMQIGFLHLFDSLRDRPLHRTLD